MGGCIDDGCGCCSGSSTCDDGPRGNAHDGSALTPPPSPFRTSSLPPLLTRLRIPPAIDSPPSFRSSAHFSSTTSCGGGGSCCCCCSPRAMPSPSPPSSMANDNGFSTPSSLLDRPPAPFPPLPASASRIPILGDTSACVRRGEDREG